MEKNYYIDYISSAEMKTARPVCNRYPDTIYPASGHRPTERLKPAEAAGAMHSRLHTLCNCGDSKGFIVCLFRGLRCGGKA